MKTVLYSKDLSFWYGEKQALKGVSLSFKERSITAIMGPSGCGKSTYLRCFNRMNDIIPNIRIEGKAIYGDQNIYDKETDPVEIRTKIGMVFQQPNPLPRSIYDNVAYGPRIAGERRKKVLDEIVEKSLRKAALWDEVKDDLKKSGLSLSGGQQQRLCLARTLAIEPKVILMDEPCSALDPIATAKIEQTMQELKKEYTIIIVTHNMQQAARASDYTAFLLMGECIEYGETKQIFIKPKYQQTMDYITGRFG
jgi:phosphate transport system ATP-binding protein